MKNRLSLKKLFQFKPWQGKDGGNIFPAEENNCLWQSTWFANCFSGHTVAQQQNKYNSLKRNMRCCIFICSGKCKCQEPIMWHLDDMHSRFVVCLIFGCLPSDKLQKIYKTQLILNSHLVVVKQMSGTNKVSWGCHTPFDC